MARYSQIQIFNTPEDTKRRFINLKYPKITLDSQDIYVYITQGDKYDSLALTFYKDSSLWWIINHANPNQDSASLYPAIGSQIRIPSPSRLSSILMQYETLNKIL
jgi:hypothetical protein